MIVMMAVMFHGARAKMVHGKTLRFKVLRTYMSSPIRIVQSFSKGQSSFSGCFDIQRNSPCAPMQTITEANMYKPQPLLATT